MLKNKLHLMALVLLVSLSSCGIFHKGCGCPTFGQTKHEIFKMHGDNRLVKAVA
jgi:hypothetical protein